VGHEEVTLEGIHEHRAMLQFSLSKEGALCLSSTASANHHILLLVTLQLIRVIIRYYRLLAVE
jgi:hypothetical protein